MNPQLPQGAVLDMPTTPQASVTTSMLPQGAVLDTPPAQTDQTRPNTPGSMSKAWGDTLMQGGKNVMADVAPIAKTGQMGLGEGVLTDLQSAGHVAGDIAGTAGGLIGDAIAPFIPQGVKDTVGNVAGYINDKINQIPGMTPELHKSIGDVISTVTLLGGGESEAPIKSAIKTGAEMTPEVAGKIVKPVTDYIAGGANKISDSFQEASLKLTPTQKVNLGSKLTEVKNYLSENNITGNPASRFEQITSKYVQKENDFQKFLNTDAKEVTVDKADYLNKLDSIKNDYKYDRDSIAINKQIDEAKQTVQTNFPDKIPVKDLNVFKRSTYDGAYNTAGNKVLDSVEHDIGDITRSEMETALNGKTINGQTMSDFNKEYGTIITARKLLKAAQGKPQLGLAGQIVSRIVGGGIGGAVGGGIPGEIIGAMAGKTAGEVVAGTAAKSKMASLLKSSKK